MSNNRRRNRNNSFSILPLVPWMVIALLLSCAGLGYVVLKNKQHQLGQEMRQVEKKIRNERAVNEVLMTQISRLSSRSALQARLHGATLALKPIQDHSIARLFPPEVDNASRILRTAANEAQSR